MEEVRKKRVEKLEIKRIGKRDYHALDRKRRGKTIEKVKEADNSKERIRFIIETNKKEIEE